MRTLVVFSAVVAALLLLSPSASAVQFGPDSAKITNPYLPLKVGSWAFSKGVGSNWNTQIFYIHAIDTETVNGVKIGAQILDNVKALKVNVAETDDGGSNEHEFFTISFAQDTDGNVWAVKVYSHMADITAVLGGAYFQSMFMPAVPAVGLPAGITLPEDAYNYCQIVQVGISSVTTNFGTYQNCIKANCYHNDPADPDETEVEYYCYGVGIVRSFDEVNPGDVVDLKEYGETSVKRAIVIPLMD
jgi:hypothetical protein